MSYRFAVDWDGTCVENAWPAMGEWLPGAVEGLRKLDEMGSVVIHSCRVAPVEFGDQSMDITWRDQEDTAAEILGIKKMLRDVGLDHIEVWTRPYKPPALMYLDDKAVRFFDWDQATYWAERLIDEARAVEGPGGLRLIADEFAPGVVFPNAIVGRDPGDEMDDLDPIPMPTQEELRELCDFIPTAEMRGEVRVVDPRTGGEKGSKLARYDLMPWRALDKVAEVYGFGCTKYEDRNWEKGYAWGLSLAALTRHVSKFAQGEYLDSESGLPHLAHAAWHCLTLMTFAEVHPELDDRSLAFPF